MRRIPRLHRPSCPAATQPSIAPLACQLPPAGSSSRASFSTTTTTTTTTTTATAGIPSRSACLRRFYSTENNNKPTTTPTPIPQSLSSRRPTSTPQQQQQQQQQEGGGDEGELTGTLSAAEAEKNDTTYYPKPQLEEPSSSSAAASSTAPTLYRTPPRRTQALRPTDVEAKDATYVAATTADGLKTVGGLAGWWDRRENWGGDFAGFRPPGQAGRVNDPALLEAAARRAVVEALALRRAGREGDLAAVWPLEDQGGGEGTGARRFLRVNVVSSEKGGVELSGDLDGLLESLTWKDDSSAVAVADKKTSLSAKEAAEIRAGWDKSWKNVPLADARIKFAVTKRIFQLTGQLIPDHRLPEINSVAVLLAVLQKPPKPKTLSDEIAKRQPVLAQELPNVSFATKRVTRGDRERAVGRFKLIEEEFKKRDLPLDGHGFAQRNKERSWLSGGT